VVRLRGDSKSIEWDRNCRHKPWPVPVCSTIEIWRFFLDYLKLKTIYLAISQRIWNAKVYGFLIRKSMIRVFVLPRLIVLHYELMKLWQNTRSLWNGLRSHEMHPRTKAHYSILRESYVAIQPMDSRKHSGREPWNYVRDVNRSRQSGRYTMDLVYESSVWDAFATFANPALFLL